MSTSTTRLSFPTLTILNNTELAFKLASWEDLPGAEDLYVRQYQQLFQSGQYGEAVLQISTHSSWRPVADTSVLWYIELNHLESVELPRPVLQRGRKQLLEKWLKENNKVCQIICLGIQLSNGLVQLTCSDIVVA